MDAFAISEDFIRNLWKVQELRFPWSTPETSLHLCLFAIYSCVQPIVLFGKFHRELTF